jgi:hypothetical protein
MKVIGLFLADSISGSFLGRLSTRKEAVVLFAALYADLEQLTGLEKEPHKLLLCKSVFTFPQD